ncbi:hypothetical protein evm_013144 [Chilo suppressalis]|nr:hypothetical protein evm_013144 [Chilo suppressalis]
MPRALFFFYISNNNIKENERVVEVPEFGGPITNLTVPIGRDATFECTVVNLGNYRVGWVKADTKAIHSNSTKQCDHRTSPFACPYPHSDHSPGIFISRNVQGGRIEDKHVPINTDPMRVSPFQALWSDFKLVDQSSRECPVSAPIERSDTSCSAKRGRVRGYHISLSHTTAQQDRTRSGHSGARADICSAFIIEHLQHLDISPSTWHLCNRFKNRPGLDGSQKAFLIVHKRSTCTGAGYTPLVFCITVSHCVMVVYGAIDAVRNPPALQVEPHQKFSPGAPQGPRNSRLTLREQLIRHGFRERNWSISSSVRFLSPFLKNNTTQSSGATPLEFSGEKDRVNIVRKLLQHRLAGSFFRSSL